MASVFYGFSSPKQEIIEPKVVNTLTLSAGTTPISTEFRWKLAGAASWSSVVTVAGTSAKYNLPANTWSRDQTYVWQARYQDSGGWSDWTTFTVDTSGWSTFAQTGSTEVLGLGPLDSAGTYSARVAVRDGAGITWGITSNLSFIIQNTRSLTKDANGRWEGVPILRHNGTSFVAAKNID